jgi:hypothetical protein
MMAKSERIIKYGLPVAAVLVAALVALGITQGNTASTAQGDLGQSNERADSLQVKADQGKTLADQIGAACAAGGQTAKDLQEKFGACSQAVVVKQPTPTPVPGAEGKQGKTGDSGRGITSTSLRGDHLFVTYTDGVEEDKGQVVGADGKTGQPGRGISATAIAAGHLVLTYTDGTTADVGQVVGKDGANGNDGVDGTNGVAGRGIAKTAISGNFHLVITYTDGTIEDLGALPAGQDGQNGKDGINGNDGQPPMGWTTRRLDGTTITCQRTASFDYQNPYYDCVQNAPEVTPTPTGTP